jgi:hypothetical protein
MLNSSKSKLPHRGRAFVFSNFLQAIEVRFGLQTWRLDLLLSVASP